MEKEKYQRLIKTINTNQYYLRDINLFLKDFLFQNQSTEKIYQ